MYSLHCGFAFLNYKLYIFISIDIFFHKFHAVQHSGVMQRIDSREKSSN